MDSTTITTRPPSYVPFFLAANELGRRDKVSSATSSPAFNEALKCSSSETKTPEMMSGIVIRKRKKTSTLDLIESNSGSVWAELMTASCKVFVRIKSLCFMLI